jgi:hypothetical protein
VKIKQNYRLAIAQGQSQHCAMDSIVAQLRGQLAVLCG